MNIFNFSSLKINVTESIHLKSILIKRNNNNIKDQRETPSEIVTLPDRKLFQSQEKTTKKFKNKKKGRNCQTTIKLSKNDFKNDLKNEEKIQSQRRSKKRNNSKKNASKSKSKSRSKSNNRNKIKKENNILINNEKEIEIENDQTKIFECLEEIRSTLQHSFDLFGNLVGLLKKEMNKNNKNNFLNKKTYRNKNKNQKFEKEEKAFSLMDFDEDYPKRNIKKNKINDDKDDEYFYFSLNKNEKTNQRKKGK